MINREGLKEAHEWFYEYVELEDGKPFESFSEGIINREEGYKRSVFEKAHSRLKLDEWKKSEIGNGFIAERNYKRRLIWLTKIC